MGALLTWIKRAEAVTRGRDYDTLESFLINLARGGVLDQDALIEHLQAGKIAGAGLDVFPTQPLPKDNPLWTMPNVIITPNIGGRSDRFVEQTLTVLEPNLAVP